MGLISFKKEQNNFLNTKNEPKKDEKQETSSLFSNSSTVFSQNKSFDQPGKNIFSTKKDETSSGIKPK